MKIKKVNPVAKAMILHGPKASVVRSKKIYNRKKMKRDSND